MENDNIDVMIDIETIGVLPTSVVLTIGALKFNPNAPSKFYDELHLKLNIEEQSHRDQDPLTLKWWEEQSEEVREAAFGGERMGTIEALTILSEFIKGAKRVWAHGPQFDMIILEDLYRMFNVPVTWKYSQIRDTRTVFDILGDKRPRERPAAHNALEDCKYQAIGVQKCLEHLKDRSWVDSVDRQGGSFSAYELLRQEWT